MCTLAPRVVDAERTSLAPQLMKVAAIDADANKGAASAFGVKGFPTIVLALDGNAV